MNSLLHDATIIVVNVTPFRIQIEGSIVEKSFSEPIRLYKYKGYSSYLDIKTLWAKLIYRKSRFNV